MSFQLRRLCSTRFLGDGSAAGPEDAPSLGLSLGVCGFGLRRNSFDFLVRPWSKVLVLLDTCYGYLSLVSSYLTLLSESN
ncbi:unnamed protein product [Lasius platythorax]|uniref:Uncharacterized protein n=1 Tax=Lasius platythorax TaxID=488582 RepID=A0AAV2MZK5_9HYME